MLYVGRRKQGDVNVFRNGVELDPKPSLKVRNHSPCGFNWGYEGSGPAQLALALLLEVTTKLEAVEHYQRFKREHVARWKDDWQIDSGEIRDWLFRVNCAILESAKKKGGDDDQ